MKPPLFLIGLALLFWGWRTDLLIWGVLMAVLIEAAQFVESRLDFSLKDLCRIWDLSTVMAVGEAAILISSQDRGQISFKFFQWLPVSLFLMMLAQVYGNQETIPLRVFSWMARRSPDSALAKKRFNISWFYFVLCVIGGSATSRASVYFFPAVVLLILLGLMAARPRRISLGRWAALVLIVGVVGFGTARALLVIQNRVEASLFQWVLSHFRREYDFRETRTSIGNVGRLKLSGQIVLRVKAESSSVPPDLLQEAVYNSYLNGVWKAPSADFKPVAVDSHETAVLQPESKMQLGLEIAGYFQGGRGILPLPHGAFELRELPVVLSTNQLGVAKIEDGPDLLDFRVRYGPISTHEGPKDSTDLDVPENERAVLRQVIDEFRLEGKSDAETIQSISKFFQENFTYSTYIGPMHVDRTGKKTGVGQFLVKARSGHCEYFATATALLLREAGIPARYVTGYSVQEHSGDNYVVRERHAHAWVLVYRERLHRWEELDTTPGSWSEIENARASAFEPVADFFSRIWFGLSQWRYGKTSYLDYVRWLLAPLIIFLAWRIIVSQRRRRGLQKAPAAAEMVRLGTDSEFYLLERRLAAVNLGRLSNEFPRQWIRRRDLPQPARLERIIHLHRRLRFDPRSLSPEDRRTLKAEVEQWLTEFDLKAEMGRRERAV